MNKQPLSYSGFAMVDWDGKTICNGSQTKYTDGDKVWIEKKKTRYVSDKRTIKTKSTRIL